MSVINKINLKGTEYTIANSAMGTCSTATATAAKVVVLDNFTLTDGVTIYVRFTYSNTASSPTLNVNSTGAKSIARSDNWWMGGAICSFTYHSSSSTWVMTACSSYYYFNLTPTIYAKFDGNYGSQLYLGNYNYINMAPRKLDSSGTTSSAGAYLKTNRIQIPSASNGDSYDFGSNHQIMISNGDTLFWDYIYNQVSLVAGGGDGTLANETGITNPYLCLTDGVTSCHATMQIKGGDGISVVSTTTGISIDTDWELRSGLSDDPHYFVFSTEDDRFHSSSRIYVEENNVYFTGGSSATDTCTLNIHGGIKFTYANDTYCRIIPAANNVGYIGTSTYRWYYGYINNFYSQSFYTNNITLQTSSGKIMPYSSTTNTCSIGSSTYQFSTIYAKNFYESGTLLSSKYVQAKQNTTSTAKPLSMMTITSSAYSSLSSKDSNTLYIIVS